MTETETVKTSNQEVLSARRNQNAKKHKTYTVLSRAPDADTNFRVSPPRKPSTQLRYRTRTNSEAVRKRTAKAGFRVGQHEAGEQTAADEKERILPATTLP